MKNIYQNNKPRIIKFLLFFLVISLLVTFSSFIEIINSNKFVLYLLIPFILGLLLLVTKFTKHINTLLSIGSILIAVLFFIFSTYQNNKYVSYSIEAAHTYNCGLASSTIPILKPNLVSYGYFIVDPYIDNITFIYEKYGVGTGNNISNAIYEMTYYNNIMKDINFLSSFINSASEKSIINLRTDQAINLLHNIKNNYCNYSKPNPFK